MKTFPGGLHLKEEKLTAQSPIRTAKPTKKVSILLSQHTGAICEPLIKIGDQVKVGQKIGDSSALISAPVHSPVSGKVLTIDLQLHPDGRMIKGIVIENDYQETIHESVKSYPDLNQLSPDEIKKAVREAGIVGLGGAAFPTHVKLSQVEIVILNGSECEPYLTVDHRLMLEEGEGITYGLKAILKATGATKGLVGIEDNKPDAVKAMEKTGLEVVPLKVKYPEGSEKQLIKSITGREVPPGGLPMDVGVVVSNVGTAAQIARTLKTGMPLIERVVTVTGRAIKTPANLKVKLGTSFADLIEECGLIAEVGKVIMGGPMMGLAQFSLEVPVIKATTGIVVYPGEEVEIVKPTPCIKCGKCVEVCPVYLLPNILEDAAENQRYDLCQEYHILDCMECGLCSYVCPAKRELIHWIKIAKAEVSRI